MIVASMGWGGDLWAKRTTRSGLRAPETEVSMRGGMAVQPGMLTVSGYDKPLRSRYETLFVTNHTDSMVTSVRMRLQYISMRGDTIHEVVRTITHPLPPKATRRLTISSWDKQLTMYYHLTDKPSRLKGTPYRINIVPEEMWVSATH